MRHSVEWPQYQVYETMLRYRFHSNNWTADKHKARVSNYLFSTLSLQLEILIPESLHLTRRHLGLSWGFSGIGK